MRQRPSEPQLLRWPGVSRKAPVAVRLHRGLLQVALASVTLLVALGHCGLGATFFFGGVARIQDFFRKLDDRRNLAKGRPTGSLEAKASHSAVLEESPVVGVSNQTFDDDDASSSGSSWSRLRGGAANAATAPAAPVFDADGNALHQDAVVKQLENLFKKEVPPGPSSSSPFSGAQAGHNAGTVTEEQSSPTAEEVSLTKEALKAIFYEQLAEHEQIAAAEAEFKKAASMRLRPSKNSLLQTPSELFMALGELSLQEDLGRLMLEAEHAEQRFDEAAKLLETYLEKEVKTSKQYRKASKTEKQLRNRLAREKARVEEVSSAIGTLKATEKQLSSNFKAAIGKGEKKTLPIDPQKLSPRSLLDLVHSELSAMKEELAKSGDM